VAELDQEFRELTDADFRKLRLARGQKPPELEFGVADDKDLVTHPFCAAKLQDKSLCRNGRVSGSLFCYFHDPELKGVRKPKGEVHEQTTKERLLPMKLGAPQVEKLDDIRKLAIETVHQIRTGELGAKEGSVISSLLNHIARSLPSEADMGNDPASRLKELLLEEDDDL